ncbi:uncharacterized protein LOC131207971 [Anopheles bellator]|uniref:uncharacterized protein LOC131207971 n=1 Tax=Anopheles bellator TaxID=139047 RepID=UPI0026472041|nr:uncharacterized protein LOC131207971 [Anopheles bellator]
MPASCVILDCNLKYTHTQEVSFHKFPFKNPELLKQWIAFTGRDASWYPTQWSTICSRHFQATDFRECPYRKMLCINAVPLIRDGSGLRETDIGTSVYEISTTEEILQRHDGCYQPEELDFSGQNEFQCPPGIRLIEAIDEELQEDDLAEITCRVCGVVYSRAADKLLSDLSQSAGVIGKYLPFVNLDLPNLPRKICGECLKMVNGFSTFCDNILRAQTDLEHRFLYDGSVVAEPSPASASIRSAPDAASKPMKIKQEPINFIKEEKIEGANSGHLRKEKELAAPEANPTASGMFFKPFQTFANDKNRIILFGNASGKDRSSDTQRDSSKNCEILEIVNLYPPIVDITSATITEMQPYENSLQPPLLPATATGAPMMGGRLKVENTADVEADLDEYYQPDLPDTLHLINTLEEHSYTKLPIQADDKDEIFNDLKTGNPHQADGTRVTREVKCIEDNEPSGVGWLCGDCGQAFRMHREMLCHRMLTCPVRRKVGGSVAAQCCRWCKRKFASAHRLRVHRMAALCPKRPQRRKLFDLKAILARDKAPPAPAVIPPAIASTDNASVPLGGDGPVEDTRYPCSMCDRTYVSLSNMRRHMATHRPMAQWNHKCGICLKIFDKLLDLKKHLHISLCGNQTINPREDSPTDPAVGDSATVGNVESSQAQIDRLLYVCSTCNKHYRSYNSLRVHESVHTGIKAYICEKCGRRFSGQMNLLQHRLTHSEIRQYHCELCPKVFKRKGGLSQHVRSVHLQIRPFQCETCGHHYALKADMARCRHSKLKDAVNY